MVLCPFIPSTPDTVQVLIDCTVNAFACSPTSNIFATADLDNIVKLWSYDRYQQTPATNMSTT